MINQQQLEVKRSKRSGEYYVPYCDNSKLLATLLGNRQCFNGEHIAALKQIGFTVVLKPDVTEDTIL